MIFVMVTPERAAIIPGGCSFWWEDMVKKADPFYKTNRWEHKRSMVLRRDGYICQVCKVEKKKAVQAKVVHHIFPREDYPQFAFENWNLISLCSQCHDEMHNRFNDKLSKKGQNLLRGTAAVNGIDYSENDQTILVVGLSGCGKSTYCRKHMDDFSLIYDMDAIASAFRLRMPHEEYFKPARNMANDFLFGFIQKAHDYCKNVFIIRTAPKIEEAEQINPTKLVVCKKRHEIREMDDESAALERIELLIEHYKAAGIEVEIQE